MSFKSGVRLMQCQMMTAKVGTVRGDVHRMRWIRRRLNRMRLTEWKGSWFHR